MPYIGTTPTKVVSRQSANVYRYTATAGQSVFTGADLDNNVLACNPADMIVHMNGLRLESTDYTATSTSVTLTTAATAGDELTVTSFVTFEVADTYTKTAADSRYVNTTGDTMTGTLSVTGGRLYVGQTAGDYAQFGKDTSGNAFIDATQSDADFGIYINSTSTGYNKKLGIDSAGRVTMPYQPAFHAQLNNVNYTASGQINIIYNYASLNRGNHYNASTGVFTAPVSGVYHITQAIATEATSSASFFVLEMLVNGALDYTRFSSSSVNSGISEGGMSTSSTIYLNANDTLKPIIYTPVTISIGRTSGGANTWWAGRNFFSGYLIG